MLIASLLTCDPTLWSFSIASTLRLLTVSSTGSPVLSLRGVSRIRTYTVLQMVRTTHSNFPVSHSGLPDTLLVAALPFKLSPRGCQGFVRG